MKRNPAKNSTDAILQELRQFGLTYPETHLKSPWPGHLDVAVRDKTVAHLSVEGEPFSMSCKLPESGALALELPFATPTGYGLGKSGWVTAKFPPGQKPPLEILKAWIDESYRAIAPKKLSALVPHRDAGSTPITAKKSTSPRKPAKKAAKAVRKKTRPRAK